MAEQRKCARRGYSKHTTCDAAATGSCNDLRSTKFSEQHYQRKDGTDPGRLYAVRASALASGGHCRSATYRQAISSSSGHSKPSYFSNYSATTPRRSASSKKTVRSTGCWKRFCAFWKGAGQVPHEVRRKCPGFTCT